MALYPFALTALILCTIELHDRNCRVLAYLSAPLKRFYRNNWNAKERVLNACVTFLLLAYSKLLFVSFSLLIAVSSYNCKGEIIPNSTVLLFDPTVKYIFSFCAYSLRYYCTLYNLCVCTSTSSNPLPLPNENI